MQMSRLNRQININGPRVSVSDAAINHHQQSVGDGH